MADHYASTLAAPSHSRLSKLHACRRAYYYKYVRGLTARGTATRLLAGKALHAAMDVLHRQGYAAIDDAHRALIAIYDGHIPGDKQAFLTTEHLMGLVISYVKRWPEPDEDYTPLRLHRSQIDSNAAIIDFGGAYDADGYAIMAEAPMVVQITPSLRMTIIIDAIVKRANGSLWVVDHKATCGWLGSGVLNRYLVSHQTPLYVAAVRAMLGECGGAMLNAIYMGEHALKATSKATKFDRYEFDYTLGQVEESVAWAIRTRDIAADEEAAGEPDAGEATWLQNPGPSCSGCEYLPLCEAGPALRPGRAVEWYDHDNNEGGQDGQDAQEG